MKHIPRTTSARWLSLLMFLSLSACSGLFGANDSSQDGINNQSGNECVRDLDRLQDLLGPNKEACNGNADCPSGSFCNGEGVCDWECYSNSDCGYNSDCDCDGQCILSDDPDRGDDEGSSLTCGRDEGLLRSLDTVTRDCVFDEDCPLGSYCSEATGSCQYECLATEHSDKGCDGEGQEGTSCDCRGQCTVPGASLPGVDEKRPSMEVEPRVLEFAENESCKQFTVTLRSDSATLPDETTVNFRGDQGLLLEETSSASPGQPTTCAGTGREVSVPGWQFSRQEDGTYAAVKHIAVELSEWGSMNLIPRSTEFVGGNGGFLAEGGVATADAELAPDGSMTADTLAAVAGSGGGGEPTPLLELDFTGTALPLQAEYIRSGTIKAITGVGPNGVEVSTFGPNEYAYAYNDAFSHESKLGALIEPAATNIVNSSDAPSYTNATVVFDSAVAPDGTTTADVVTGLAGNSRLQAQTAVGASNTDYVYSVFVRLADGATDSTFALRVDGPGAGSSTMTNFTATPEWQRFSITWNSGPDTPGDYKAFVWVSSPDRSVEAWGFQVEEGTVPSSYIPTSGAPANRGQTLLRVQNALTNGYIDLEQGEFQTTFVFNDVDGSKSQGIHEYGGNGRKLGYRPGGGNNYRMQLRDGEYRVIYNSPITVPGGWQADQEYRAVLSWDHSAGGRVGGALDDAARWDYPAEADPGQFDNPINVGVIGSNANSQLRGVVSTMKVFGTPVTGTETGGGNATVRTSFAFEHNPFLDPTHTFSLWIKDVGNASTTVRLSATDSSDAVLASTAVPAGSSWARQSFTFPAAIGTTTLHVEILEPAEGAAIALWGAQLETGGAAGTYIPTAGEPVLPGPSGRSNQLPHSERFDRWTPHNFPTVLADRAAAPDGSRTADYLANPDGTGEDGVWISAGNFPSTTDAFAYTASLHMRWASDVEADVTLRTLCSNGASLYGGIAVFTVSGEWERYELTDSSPASESAGTNFCRLFIFVDHGEPLYLWGAQLEVGDSATAYIPTEGSPVTRRSLGTREGPWTIRINSAQTAGAASVLVADAPPPEAPPTAGRYAGFIRFVDEENSDLQRMPVRASSFDATNSLFILDDTRVIDPDGGFLLENTAAPQIVPWVSRDDGATLAADISVVSWPASGATGDLEDIELNVRLPGALAPLPARVSLSFVGPFIDDSQSCAVNACESGETCLAQTSQCVPAYTLESESSPPSFANDLVSEFHEVARDALWLSDLSVFQGTMSAADHYWVEQLLCYDPADEKFDSSSSTTFLNTRGFHYGFNMPNTSREETDDPEYQRSDYRFYSFLPSSGDLPCGGTTVRRVPSGVVADLLRDRKLEDDPTADLAATELLRSCVQELRELPNAPSIYATDNVARAAEWFGNSFDNRCASLAHYVPALWASLFRGLDPENPWPGTGSRTRKLAQRLLTQWLAMTNFIGRQGRQEAELDRVLDVTNGGDLEIESIVERVRGNLALLLDPSVQAALRAMPADEIRFRDYRLMPRPVAYWPFDANDFIDESFPRRALDVVGGRHLSMPVFSSASADGEARDFGDNPAVSPVVVPELPIAAGGDLTVSAWIDDSTRTLLSYSPAGADGDWLRIRIINDPSAGATGKVLDVDHTGFVGRTGYSNPLPLNSTGLNHLVVTRNAQSRIYVVWLNGVRVYEDAWWGVDSSAGRRYNPSPEPGIPELRLHLKGAMADVAVYGEVLTDEQVEAIYARNVGDEAGENPLTRSPLVPHEFSTDRDQTVGLPVHILEAATEYVRTAEAHGEKLAWSVYESCEGGRMSSAQNAAVSALSSPVRETLALETLARDLYEGARVGAGCSDDAHCFRHGSSATCQPWRGTMACFDGAGDVVLEETPWDDSEDREKAWELAARELASARSSLTEKIRSIARCENPMKIAENVLPLFFGDVAGTNSRFFASSDYLLNTWAGPAVTKAAGALESAKSAWLSKKQSEIQQLSSDYEQERRAQAIASGPGAQIIELCGFVGVEPSEAPYVFDGALSPDNCFVKQVSQCERSQTANQCLQGRMGSALIAVQSAELSHKAAIQAAEDAQERYARSAFRCAQREVELANNLEALENHQEAVASIREQQRIAANTGGWLSIPSAVVSLNPIGPFIDYGIREFEADIQKENDEYERIAARRANEQAIRQCYFESNQIRIGITQQWMQVARALKDAQGALLSFQNMKDRVRQLVYEAQAGAERERARPMPSVAHHHWLDDRIDAFKRDFAWAKRLSYLAAVAVEFEFQQSLGAREKVVAASNPDQLEDALLLLRQEQAGRTINNRRPEEGTLVVSLRDELMGLQDWSVVESLEGERSDAAAQRFGARLEAQGVSSIFDQDGRYLGQGIEFWLRPIGALKLRCAERLWRVTATIQGDFTNVEEPSAPLVLMKNNTFESQWCYGRKQGDSPVQEASVSNTANLFRDENGGISDGPREAFTSSLMQPWFNVRRSDFYKSTYHEGSSEELAGRGLYGQYVLVLPNYGMLNWTDCRPSRAGGDCSSFPIHKIEDILLRFDYLSVDNIRSGLTDEEESEDAESTLLEVNETDETWFMSR